jgi:hypothetical protein
VAIRIEAATLQVVPSFIFGATFHFLMAAKIIPIGAPRHNNTHFDPATPEYCGSFCVYLRRVEARLGHRVAGLAGDVVAEGYVQNLSVETTAIIAGILSEEATWLALAQSQEATTMDELEFGFFDFALGLFLVVSLLAIAATIWGGRKWTKSQTR